MLRPTLATLVVLIATLTVAGPTSEPVAASPDPIVVAAGDIVCDPTSSSINDGLGTSSARRQRYTSDLFASLAPVAVLTLGDNQYSDGAYDKFVMSYDPSWGRAKGLTRPVPGNHEYELRGAEGYFQYCRNGWQPLANRAAAKTAQRGEKRCRGLPPVAAEMPW